MNVIISSYNKVSEVNGIIENIIKNENPENLRFIIPSRKDKSILADRFNNIILWSWQDIYNDVYSLNKTSKKRVLSPPDHFLILDEILKSACSKYPEKIKDLPGIERSGFLNVISEDIKELLNEAVRPENLIPNPESSNPSEFLLPEVYALYIKYLDNYNLLDSAQRCTASYDAVNENQEWGKDFVIVFAGFMSFNHSQFELVQALAERCKKIIIIRPETHLSDFHGSDFQFHMKSHIKKSSGKIIEILSADPGLEPEIIARTLALWHAGEWEHEKIFPGFDSIAMMISQGEEESFASAFKRYGVPCDFMEGIKINHTLPGKILSSIRNLRTANFPSYETAMLFTQPCFAGIKFPFMRAYRSGCSGLENWEKYLSEKVNDPDEKLKDVFQIALISIRAVKKFCSSLSRLNTPLKIMTAFYEFLTTENLWLDAEDKIKDFPELDESRRVTASAIQTVKEKVLALDELMPDLGMIQDQKMRDDAAFEFLDRWCSNSYTRAPIQISNAVRIFTQQPPVLASFPVWIMTGVTQKAWSGNIKSSPLLGNNEREKLRENNIFLPETHEKATRREALFRRLIMTGENLTIISRPQLDEEGRPLSESPFMNKFFEDLPDWKNNSEKLKSEGIKILLGGDNFIFPEVDASEKIPREFPLIQKKSAAVGASDIHELLSCPFLWWQKRQAGLYEQDTEIISPVEWGIMLHKFWENVWRRYRLEMNSSGKNFFLIAKNEWKKLSENQSEDYEKFSRLVKDFRLKRKLAGIKFRVKRLSSVQSQILDNLHNAGYEHEKILLEDEAHLKNNIDGITFLGQCDRIEILKNPDGEEILFIADYKEGWGENSEKGMTKIKDYAWNFEGREKFNYGLQLSVYAALAENHFNISPAGVYILGLEDGKISGSFSEDILELFKENSSGKFNKEISKRFDEGDYAMKCAVEVLKNSEFQPDYKSDFCRLCNIKSLCRKGEFRGDLIISSENEE